MTALILLICSAAAALIGATAIAGIGLALWLIAGAAYRATS